MPVYCSCTCQTSGAVAERILSGCFLRNGSLDFPEFWHGTRNPYEVVHDNPNLLKNFFCPQNWGN